jgi:hypothetical protein
MFLFGGETAASPQREMLDKEVCDRQFPLIGAQSPSEACVFLSSVPTI